MAHLPLVEVSLMFPLHYATKGNDGRKKSYICEGVLGKDMEVRVAIPIMYVLIKCAGLGQWMRVKDAIKIFKLMQILLY